MLSSLFPFTTLLLSLIFDAFFFPFFSPCFPVSLLVCMLFPNHLTSKRHSDARFPVFGCTHKDIKKNVTINMSGQCFETGRDYDHMENHLTPLYRLSDRLLVGFNIIFYTAETSVLFKHYLVFI